jgi:AcrR family transcriptional regulator
MNANMTSRPPSRKPKRTASESAEFRDRIILAARELFLEEGFGSVSIRKIAAKAGCPTMTFYVFFKSKRALLWRIWEDVFAELIALCNETIASQPDPETRLTALIRTLFGYWADRPDSYRIVFMHQEKMPADTPEYYVDSADLHKRLQLINGVIEEGVATGAFRAVDSELAAQVLFATVIGLAHVMITIPEYPWMRGQLLDGAVQIALNGLRPSA